MRFFFYLSFLLLFSPLNAQSIDLQLVASGFSDPLEIKHAGDSRMFIVEQGGIIKILNADGTVNTTPYLDISSQVQAVGERGLLGLAFHPSYSSNGFFYVYYTNTGGNSQISRFSVSAGNANIADPASEIQLLTINQPFTNHNGGHLAFGPDGKLYIASGDGGSSGDPGDRAQSLNTLLGKLLRLDVDIAAPYIPADNPFVSNTNALNEIWAYGLRNPWKFSFDTVAGNIWIADVGQSSIEEINRQTASTAGLNYGWRCYEGNQVFNTSGNCPNASALTFPIAQYARTGDRCSITGGYVYRGTEFPSLQGLYFFADLCSHEIGTVDSGGNIVFHGTFSATTIVSFGTDVNENLYLAAFGGGSIYKIIDSSLSLNDPDKSNFSIYPNPANTEVNLNFTQEHILEVTVYDLKGKIIYQQDTSGKNQITFPVNYFSTGLYIIETKNNAGQKNYQKLFVK